MVLGIVGSKPNYMGGYDLNSEQNRGIIEKLEKTIERKLKTEDRIDFMFNGQIGTSQVACEIVLRMRKEGKHKNIGKITLVLSNKDMYSKWFGDNLKRYNEHLEQADEVIYLDTIKGYTVSDVAVGEYHFKKTKNVEKYLVEKVDGLLVVSNTRDKVTEDFIIYASQNNKPVGRIDTTTFKLTAITASAPKATDDVSLDEDWKRSLERQNYLNKSNKYKKAILDTETNGLITKGNPPKYPDIAQLSYILLDENDNVECAKNFYFKLTTMSEGAENVHGLSLEKLEKLSGGKTFEHSKYEILNDLLGREIVCHNVAFDVPVMNNSLGGNMIGQNSICTMEWYTDILKLYSPYFKYKKPRLEEVINYYDIQNEELLKTSSNIYNAQDVGYHDSRFDTVATYEIYKRIR